MVSAGRFGGLSHAERSADVPTCERRARDFKPFRRRMCRIAPQYLDDLAVAKLCLKGNHFPVDFGTLQMVAEVAVYRVGEIDRC